MPRGPGPTLGRVTSRRPEETYTHGHLGVVVASHATRTVDDSALFLLPHLEPGMRLLDVGCGPGTITVGLARRVAPGRVVGIDAAAEVLEEARAHAAGVGVDNVEFHEASIYDLPFRDGGFDVVYAHQFHQHLADPVASLREIRRVLSPGGLVAVRDADFATMTAYPPDPLLDRWLEVYEAVHRANGGEPDAGRRLLSWALEAGFVDAVATTSTWTYADPERRRHWGELWAQRISQPPFSERALEIGAADSALLEAIGAAFLRWMTEPDGWFAFIHGEVVARRPR